MITLPKSLLILDAAVASDGGSTYLGCRNSEGNEVHINLAWAIDLQIKGEGQLSINDVAILKRSPQEAELLQLLLTAQCKWHNKEDQTEYSEAIRSTAESLITKVQSDIYVNGIPQQDIERSDTIAKANSAFRKKEWAEVVSFLKEYEESLSQLEKKKLDYARKQLSRLHHG